MRESRPIIRPATRADIEAFSSAPNKPTIRAWVGVLDEEIIGIGGYAFSHGRWFAFCDLTEGAKPYKLLVARTAKMIMSEAKKQGIRFVYAEANTDEPNAVRWLKSLGFTIDQRSGSLFRWQAS